MTNIDRICATLNAVARVGAVTGGMRDLPTLLEAFNRTILPRRFLLQHKRGEIAFLVSNRRLHRMEHASARGLPWNRPLGAEHRADVGKALLSLCAAAPLDRVDVTPCGPGAPFDGLGIAAPALIEFVGSSVAALPDLQMRIVEFARRYPERVEASFLMAEDAIAALTGSEEDIERVLPSVSDMLDRATAPTCSLAASLETDGALAVPRPPHDGGSFLIAGEVGLLGVLVLRDLPATDAMVHWRTAQVA